MMQHLHEEQAAVYPRSLPCCHPLNLLHFTPHVLPLPFWLSLSLSLSHWRTQRSHDHPDNGKPSASMAMESSSSSSSAERDGVQYFLAHLNLNLISHDHLHYGIHEVKLTIHANVKRFSLSLSHPHSPPPASLRQIPRANRPIGCLVWRSRHLWSSNNRAQLLKSRSLITFN